MEEIDAEFDLFEGLAAVLSQARVAVLQQDIGADHEIWTLQMPEQT